MREALRGSCEARSESVVRVSCERVLEGELQAVRECCKGELRESVGG